MSASPDVAEAPPRPVPVTANNDATPEAPRRLDTTHHVSDINRFLVSVGEDVIARGERAGLIAELQAAKGPASELSIIIRKVYWDRLVRCMDEDGIAAILKDTKRQSGEAIVYVPKDDLEAHEFYMEASRKSQGTSHPFSVRILPENPGDPAFVKSIEGEPGILSLALYRDEAGRLRAKPFAVPGGRFNELYGWDTPFIAFGLIQDGFLDLARSMLENHIYEIKHYGRILNGNRSYYLSRSQPPLMVPMAEQILAEMDKLGKWKSDDDRSRFIEEVLDAAIAEHRNVWLADVSVPHSSGLSRYFDRGEGFCAETEPGHYDSEIAGFVAAELGLSIDQFLAKPPTERRELSQSYIDRYNRGEIEDAAVRRFIEHDRSQRASGTDTTYRTVGKCADLLGADLNSLLFAMESGIARLQKALPAGRSHSSNVEKYEDMAERRRATMTDLLWNEAAGTFFDLDFGKEPAEQQQYYSAQSFFALYTGVASEKQAKSMVEKFLPKLEALGGILGSTFESRGEVGTEARPLRQWDAPFGWAPQQIVAWQGLLKYGYVEEAQRLAYKWLLMITREAKARGGAVVERYDVQNANVFEGGEYGAQGLEPVVDQGSGFGWTNASFQIGLSILSEAQRSALDAEIEFDVVFQTAA